MSRPKTQRGKTRAPTQGDKRKKEAAPPPRADTVDRAIDALDVTLEPVPRRPDAKRRESPSADPPARFRGATEAALDAISDLDVDVDLDDAPEAVPKPPPRHGFERDESHVSREHRAIATPATESRRGPPPPPGPGRARPSGETAAEAALDVISELDVDAEPMPVHAAPEPATTPAGTLRATAAMPAELRPPAPSAGARANRPTGAPVPQPGPAPASGRVVSPTGALPTSAPPTGAPPAPASGPIAARSTGAVPTVTPAAPSGRVAQPSVMPAAEPPASIEPEHVSVTGGRVVHAPATSRPPTGSMPLVPQPTPVPTPTPARDSGRLRVPMPARPASPSTSTPAPALELPPAQRASRDVAKAKAALDAMVPLRDTPPPEGDALDALADLDDEPSPDDFGAGPQAGSEPEIQVRFGSEYPRFQTPSPVRSRAVSVGETSAEDLVVDVEELPEIRRLAVAVFDDADHADAAEAAIEAAGHEVVQVTAEAKDLDDVLDAMRQLDVVLVGMPGGEPVIEAALGLVPNRPVVVAACDGPAAAAVQLAMTSGADLVTVRPHDDARLAAILLAAGRLADERVDPITTRGRAETESGAVMPLEQFKRTLEFELKRARRYAYPIAVALFAVEHGKPPPPPGVPGIVRARAGNALIHTIRDIDIVTELDHERYLVLLPYTTLDGAVEVARRIIAAVGACDPVIAMGRTFPPRVIGAVSAAAPGQAMAFSRLMRDAMRALDQARREGADLAVQP